MGDDQIVISSAQVFTPETVVDRSFTSAFRGYHPVEVRQFLKRVSEEMAAAAEREAELRTALQDAQARVAHPELDEATLTSVLGEHAARLLASARETATSIVEEARTQAQVALRDAEQRTARMREESESLMARRVAEADAAAASIREAARAEAEAEVEQAKQQGKEMVGEARAVRERMLADLARRRRSAQVQIEQLRVVRERLLSAYDVVRRTVEEATAELEAAEPEARIAADEVARRAGEPDGGTDVEPALPAPARRAPPPVSERPAPASAAFRTLDASRPAPPAPPARPPLRPQTVAGAVGGRTPPVVAADEPAEAVAPAAEVATPPADEIVAPATEPTAEDVPPETVVTVAGLLVSEPVPDEPAPAADLEPAGMPPLDLPPVAVPPAAAMSELSTSEVPAITGDVEELFARLRADRRPVDAPAAAPEQPPAEMVEPAVGPAPTEAPAVDAVTGEHALEGRDDLLDNLEAGLTRALKRVLGDEQNEVLDGLRRLGTAAAAAVLPPADAQVAGYRDAAVPWLQQAARAGVGFVSDPESGTDAENDHPALDAQADALARDLVEPLRERLSRALAGAADADDPSVVAESLRATYRQWKVSQVEECARHHVMAAFSLGAFAAMPDVATLQWLVDDDGHCPDCDDNALAGPTPKGEPFPTGQLHPPAHPGCRCLLVPVTA